MDQSLIIRGQKFESLPVPKTSTGKPRHVGFEFEYTGILIHRCAELLVEEFCGEVCHPKALECIVKGSKIGDIRIESDWDFIQNISKMDKSSLPKPISQLVDEGLKHFSEIPTLLIPWEIITEPLTENQLIELEALRVKLHTNNAHGTTDHFSYAFGTHINCEIPSEKVEDILSYLRAFLVLYPLLLTLLRVSPTRRLLSFIDHFPDKYAKLILNPNYQPDWNQFIRDYIKHNKTRNRALDLLPIFAKHYPELMNELFPAAASFVKPRPAFHYRLPNSDFGNANWRIASIWNSWVAIENLANDKERLTEMSQKRLKDLSEPFWKTHHDPLGEFKSFFNIED